MWVHFLPLTNTLMYFLNVSIKILLLYRGLFLNMYFLHVVFLVNYCQWYICKSIFYTLVKVNPDQQAGNPHASDRGVYDNTGDSDISNTWHNSHIKIKELQIWGIRKGFWQCNFVVEWGTLSFIIRFPLVCFNREPLWILINRWQYSLNSFWGTFNYLFIVGHCTGIKYADDSSHLRFIVLFVDVSKQHHLHCYVAVI